VKTKPSREISETEELKLMKSVKVCNKQTMIDMDLLKEKDKVQETEVLAEKNDM